jgi:hypothetical protein
MPADPENADEITASAHQSAAQSTALCVLISLLISKGALDQGEVIARYEALSKEFMTMKGGAYMVALADQIADFAAGRSHRKPS